MLCVCVRACVFAGPAHSPENSYYLPPPLSGFFHVTLGPSIDTAGEYINTIRF